MESCRTPDYEALYAELARFFPPSRLFTDPLHVLAYGTDASFYRLIPKIVIKADCEEEMVRIIGLCRRYHTPMTFRAAGTSLSGQALTDSVLVLAGHGWKTLEIHGQGEKITLGPGVTGGEANRALAAYGRKIGPDPASLESAMIGGIAANNASGMCCGISQNSYRTVSGMKVILADGTLLDTADRRSRQAFEETHRGLIRGLSGLRDDVLRNKTLCETIRRKYRIKNTTGYSLNAFLDFEDPIDILEHLMIGSEGTLGFMSRITYRTVPDAPFRAAALLYFHHLDEACSAASLLADSAVDAAEIMDRASLEAVAFKTAMPVPEGDVCALLLEVRGGNPAELDRRTAAVTLLIKSRFVRLDVQFSSDPAEIKAMWDVRKGLFPSVGAVRRAGTSVIIEDVCFPLERLAEGARDLRLLLNRRGYPEAIIFGHALAGNLHFVFKEDWADPEASARYGRLMEELVCLIADRYQGSLKAEHGTGRNMAPFVEKEWGHDAYAFMKSLKRLLDPEEILNPGVILNPDPGVHLKNLKRMPAAHAEIDACIECGFCEAVCPSKNLTLTPRQRIVAYREITRLRKNPGDGRLLREFESRFAYEGDATCAADGLCAVRCPVNIDTGRLIKTLRSGHLPPWARMLGFWTARHFGFALGAGRVLLRAGHFISRGIGPAWTEKAGLAFHRLSGGAFPRWQRFLPEAAPRIRAREKHLSGAKPAVVFPSCLSRIFLSPGQTRPLWRAAESLLCKAGYAPVFPRGLDGLCCGLAFESKGHAEAARFKLQELEERLWEASLEGRYPVFFDTSPCYARLLEHARREWAGGLYEPAGFVRDVLSKTLVFRRVPEELALHVPCSSKKWNLESRYREAAALLTDKVFEIPIGCCGFAGDKGLNVPELADSALSDLKLSARGGKSRGISASLPCEIGLSQHAGIAFQSILYLADECSTPQGEGERFPPQSALGTAPAVLQ